MSDGSSDEFLQQILRLSVPKSILGLNEVIGGAGKEKTTLVTLLLTKDGTSFLDDLEAP